jgi:anti-anti-sigma factor
MKPRLLSGYCEIHGFLREIMEKLSTIVVKLPEVFGARAARKLRRELKKKIKTSDPQLIVDLSRVKRIDLDGLEALLSCMEEIARQDGALQFSGISAEAATFLELTRMDRLFQKFPAFAAEAPAFALAPEPVDETTATESTAVQLPVAA